MAAPDHFTVYLPGNSPGAEPLIQSEYENPQLQAHSYYKTTLDSTIDLEGDGWEVGLAEICFPPDLYSIVDSFRVGVVIVNPPLHFVPEERTKFTATLRDSRIGSATTQVFNKNETDIDTVWIPYGELKRLDQANYVVVGDPKNAFFEGDAVDYENKQDRRCNFYVTKTDGTTLVPFFHDEEKIAKYSTLTAVEQRVKSFDKLFPVVAAAPATATTSAPASAPTDAPAAAPTPAPATASTDSPAAAPAAATASAPAAAPAAATASAPASAPAAAAASDVAAKGPAAFALEPQGDLPATLSAATIALEAIIKSSPGAKARPIHAAVAYNWAYKLGTQTMPELRRDIQTHIEARPEVAADSIDQPSQSRGVAMLACHGYLMATGQAWSHQQRIRKRCVSVSSRTATQAHSQTTTTPNSLVASTLKSPWESECALSTTLTTRLNANSIETGRS